MLTRLYEIEEGDIFINGINIKEFDKREYYKMFSVVFQEFQMMALPSRKMLFNEQRYRYRKG